MNYYDRIQFLLEAKYKGLYFFRFGGDPDRYDDGTDPQYTREPIYQDSLNPKLKSDRADGFGPPGEVQRRRLDPGEKYNREWGRNVTAHEAMHSRLGKQRNPLLRKLARSEILSSAYGGWRGPVPGSPISQRIKGAFRDVKQYGVPADIYKTGLEKPINRITSIPYRIKQSFGPNSSIPHRIRNLIAGKPFGF